MKKLTIILLPIFLGFTLMIPTKGQASSSSIVLSEVMTGYVDGLSKEFIELYSNQAEAVDISGWSIEYKSATGTSWSKRAIAAQDTLIEPKQFLVFSTETDGNGDTQKLTSGMSQTGGNVRLRNKEGVVIDQVAWGDGNAPEGSAVGAPAVGQSMARKVVDGSESMVDSDDNSQDFELAPEASPGAFTSKTSDDVDALPQVNPGTSQYGEVIISELLPDPQSPLADSTDEFIELYNESTQALSLEGWSIRDNTNHVFKLAGITIGPKSFLVLKSAQTKISLNNDGDEIFLVDPSGSIVDSTPNYGAAKPGLSWGLADGAWSWLEEPTPGASNAAQLAVVVPTPKSFSTTKKTAPKKSTKPKSAKKTKSKKPSKIAAANASSPRSYIEPTTTQDARLWSWLLIALGVGTIVYGIYAYKPEITHFIQKFRTNTTDR